MKIIKKNIECLFANSVVLISTGNMENNNILTVSSIGLMGSNILAIAIKENRFSLNIIRDIKEMVVNLTTLDLMNQTDFCGMISGKGINKFKIAGLTPERSNSVNAPLIKESPINLECKVVNEYVNGEWTIFLAEILDVHLDEKILTEDQKSIDNNKIKPLLFNTADGGYWVLSNKVGFAGKEGRMYIK